MNDVEPIESSGGSWHGSPSSERSPLGERTLELKPGESVRRARMRLAELGRDQPHRGGALPMLGIRSPLGLAAALLIGGFVLARVPVARSLARFGVAWTLRGVVATGAREIVRALAARR